MKYINFIDLLSVLNALQWETKEQQETIKQMLKDFYLLKNNKTRYFKIKNLLDYIKTIINNQTKTINFLIELKINLENY